MKKAEIQTLSIAAPAYNEAAGIESVTAEWIAYLRAEPAASRFEIVICNDGSRDRTGAILDEIREHCPEMKPVHHTVNQGAAAALTTAIRHTTGDWVLLLDSDGQFPIRNLPAMLAVMNEETLAVTGARTAKRDSAFAQIGSSVSGRLCNWFHGTRYRDFNCALKLVRGDILRSLPLEARGLNYSGEITSRLLERGVVPVEVEVEHRDRKQGVSSARRFRSAADRLLFVLYIGFRQFLIRQAVLQRTPLGIPATSFVAKGAAVAGNHDFSASVQNLAQALASPAVGSSMETAASGGSGDDL
jgi:glycosyltransferase involved in cell wall biosynthesis